MCRRARLPPKGVYCNVTHQEAPGEKIPRLVVVGLPPRDRQTRSGEASNTSQAWTP